MLCETCHGMLRGQDGRLWKGTYDLDFNHHTKMKDLHRSATHCGICRVLFEALRTELEAVSPHSPQTKLEPAKPLRLETNLESTLAHLQSYWILGQVLRLLYIVSILRWLQDFHSICRLKARLGPTIDEDVPAPDNTNDLAVSITASLRLGHQEGHQDVVSGVQSTEELYQLAFKLRCGQVRCRRIFALKKIGMKAVGSVTRSLLIDEPFSRRPRPSIPNANGTYDFV
jgi:hypothetical protein